MQTNKAPTKSVNIFPCHLDIIQKTYQSQTHALLKTLDFKHPQQNCNNERRF